jgi:hypothetical protein
VRRHAQGQALHGGRGEADATAVHERVLRHLAEEPLPEKPTAT